jgi:hypothetical protein
MSDYDYIDDEGYVYCEICGQPNGGIVDEEGFIHDGGPAMGYCRCDCDNRSEALLTQFDAWYRQWREQAVLPPRMTPEDWMRHAASSAFSAAGDRSREANQRLFDAVTEMLDELHRTMEGDLPVPVLMAYLEITYQIRERLDEARQVGFFWLSETPFSSQTKETA